MRNVPYMQDKKNNKGHRLSGMTGCGQYGQ